MNYWQQFPTRIKAFFIGVFATATALILLTSSLNNYLQHLKPQLLTLTKQTLKTNIQFDQINYLFPNKILITNLNLFPSIPLNKPLLQIPKLKISLALIDLIFRHNLAVTKISIQSSQINGDSSWEDWGALIHRVGELIKNLPLEDINVQILKTQIYSKHFKTLQPAIANLKFKIGGNQIRSTGDIQFPKENPWNFYIQAQLNNNNFIDLKKLVITHQHFFVNLWGEGPPDAFNLYGYATDETALKSFYLLDIDSQLQLTPEQFKIKNLKANLNNIPVVINGNVFFRPLVHFDLTMRSILPLTNNLSLQNCKEIFISTQGEVYGKDIQTRGIISLIFIKNNSVAFPLEKIDLKFNKLDTILHQFPSVRFNLTQGQVTFWVNGNSHQLSLENFKGKLDWRDKRYKLIEFYSPQFVAGTIQGKLWIDTNHFPSRVVSRLTLKDIDTNQLSGLLVHFKKVEGRLTSQILFSNTPKLNLQGNFLISNGHVYDFEFLKWVSQSFDLPALADIKFSQASTHFFANASEVGLSTITLKSPEANLEGYFNVGTNNRVSSQITLRLNSAIMHQSKTLKPLLNRLRKKRKSFDFPFALSGSLNTINFEWLDSDLKAEIRSKIPDFIERHIERKLSP